MSRHAVRGEEDNQQNQEQPKVRTALRVYSVILIIVGFMAGAAGISYGASVHALDPLVTPRGWLVVAGTTVFAVGTLVGGLGLIGALVLDRLDRIDRRARQAVDIVSGLAESMGEFFAIVEQHTSEQRLGREELARLAREFRHELEAAVKRAYADLYVDHVSGTSSGVRKFPGQRPKAPDDPK